VKSGDKVLPRSHGRAHEVGRLLEVASNTICTDPIWCLIYESFPTVVSYWKQSLLTNIEDLTKLERALYGVS
jgi:hypothetical protein